MNLTDIFVNNLYNFSKRDFSDTEILHAKKCLLDYLGVTLAGAKAYEVVENNLFASYLLGGDSSTIIGTTKKATPPIAALINGISAHAVELDDGQRVGNVHPGAPVISALLAEAECCGSTMNDLWRGILSGYECVLRLACSIQPGHKLKGFHATGPCGTIGAAIAIAAMLNYSKEQFKAALSVACTSASGILEMIEGDTQLMPYNSGKAASNAVISTSIAYAGFKYPEDAFGGRRGFLNCFADVPQLEILTDFGDKRYCLSNYFKLYAACGHCHASIDASLRLRERHNIVIEEIERIEIETYKLALQGHDHNVIDGVNSARMSIPYSAAVALLHGSADIDDFDERTINEEKLIELTSKITVKENEKLTNMAPQKRPAVLTIYTKTGIFSDTVYWPKGQPENPLSLEDIVSKFNKYALISGMSPNKIKQILDLVFDSTGTIKVKTIMDCLVSQ